MRPEEKEKKLEEIAEKVKEIKAKIPKIARTVSALTGKPVPESVRKAFPEEPFQIKRYYTPIKGVKGPGIPRTRWETYKEPGIAKLPKPGMFLTSKQIGEVPGISPGIKGKVARELREEIEEGEEEIKAEQEKTREEQTEELVDELAKEKTEEEVKTAEEAKTVGPRRIILEGLVYLKRLFKPPTPVEIKPISPERLAIARARAKEYDRKQKEMIVGTAKKVYDFFAHGWKVPGWKPMTEEERDKAFKEMRKMALLARQRNDEELGKWILDLEKEMKEIEEEKYGK